jgi:hypothetical protein
LVSTVENIDTLKKLVLTLRTIWISIGLNCQGLDFPQNTADKEEIFLPSNELGFEPFAVESPGLKLFPEVRHLEGLDVKLLPGGRLSSGFTPLLILGGVITTFICVLKINFENKFFFK